MRGFAPAGRKRPPRLIKQNLPLYVMILPGLLFYVIFRYIPIGGIAIAFEKYTFSGGMWHSPWIGLANFVAFFNSPFFIRLVRNTFVIGLLTLIFGFPVPVLFALMLNETRHPPFKNLAQGASYLPHFISIVIVAGMTISILSPATGMVNAILQHVFGLKPVFFLANPRYFRGIYVTMTVWKTFGWTSVTYLATLSALDPNLHEAAGIDGASRLQKIVYITIPQMVPIIVIMLILRLGSILDVSFESVILLYNPLTYDTADVISTFVYRRGIVGEGTVPNYSFSTAVGLFQSVINFVFLIGANWLSRRVSDYSLW